MNKSLKKWLIICLSITCILSAFTACNNPTNPEKKLTIQTALINQIVDVEKYVNIPDAIVVDEDGKQVSQEVKLKIYNPQGGIVSAWSGDFKVPSTGVWKVIYTSDNADDLTVELTCQDLSAPEYVVNDLYRFVKINNPVDVSVFTFSDYSGINAEKTYVEVYYKNGESWEKQELSQNGNSFTPVQEGNYKIVAKTADNLGREGSYEFMIYAVNEAYQIPDMASGYVAEYNAGIYEYLIGSAGTIDNVSSKTDPVVSYAGEVTGALNADAIKATVYKGEHGATMRLTLPAVATGSLSGHGEHLTLRFKGESQIAKTYINGITSTENVAVIGDADENGWQIMEIPLTALDSSAYNIRSIEIVLGDRMKDVEEWYFDFVKMSFILGLPDKFDYSYENQKLSWQAIPNAVGYEVFFGGEKHVVTDSNIEVPLGEKVQVKALGNTANYLDSVWTNEFNALDIEKGYITEFNNEYFESTVDNGQSVNSWWAPGVMQAEYVDSNVVGARDGDAIKATMSIKTSDNVSRTAVNLNLPQVYNKTLSSEHIRARIRIDNPSVKVSELWWNGTPSTGVTSMVGKPDENGWIVLSMPISVTNGLYGLKTLTIGFLGFEKTDTQFEVYVDWVKAVESLATPQNIRYNNSTGTLSWNAVTNATSYVISYDGQEIPVDGTSATVPANKKVFVKAVSTYFDESDWSKPALTMLVEDGYLVDFNHSAYESYIEEGVYSTFWKADAVSAEYVANGVTGADGGDAMKVTVDIAKCRENKGMSYFIINFLANKGANLVGNAVQIRFKATYNEGANNVDPFLYVINETTAVVNGLNGSADVVSVNLDVSEPDTNGWRVLSIPISSIPGGVENVSTLGIAFYQYVGVDDGEGEIYLDYIKVMQALDMPSNLKYVGGNVTWDAVTNATSYVVKYDDREYTTSSTSYAVASGKSVTVKAVGTGYIDSVWSAPVLTISIPTGYIADFNNAIYANMVIPGVPIIGDYWDPTSITNTYVSSGVTGAENGDALAIKISNNKNGYSAVTINLPNVPSGSLSGSTIKLRFKLMNGAESKEMFLYNLNGGNYVASGLQISAPDSNGWRTLSISTSNPYSINSIGVGFYGLEKNGQCTLYLDYVKVA
jgi:hypothetical protein